MLSLTCISISKTHILASLPNHQPSPSLPPQTNPHKPNSHRIKTANPLSPPQLEQQQERQQQQRRKKPSVAEMERAIGAGVFRDRDTTRDSEQEKTLFDAILSNTIGRTEGPMEKRLRETGEWLLDLTENKSRNAGKTILMVLCIGILPMWILSLLVASGTMKLPFSNDFIDDLLM